MLLIGCVPAFAVLRVAIGAHSSAKVWPWANQDAYFLKPPYAGVFDGVSSAVCSRAYASGLAVASRSYLRSIDVADAPWRAVAQQALHQLIGALPTGQAALLLGLPIHGGVRG